MNGTDTRAEEAALALALSVTVTVISAIGLLLNAYILFVIVITKQVFFKPYGILLARKRRSKFDFNINGTK
ncbi:unnamed protein product [Arctia plantaginis]|uniref:Uncharacterized protein n=1 Tax=Arctia plantaginis TaxID=874455 RepID=A0A8S1BP88_ARCPL|nr:unnamed protein product [Arctia plantaginis]CAB3261630.1 unnamed protein product [Arctia plantaginis]